jgi:hypothetical protein
LQLDEALESPKSSVLLKLEEIAVPLCEPLGTERLWQPRE